MTVKEIDELLAWCRNKLNSAKKRLVSEKYKSGYEDAMLAVMSYLHDKKNKA
jgi:predicted DNA-binding WGR domain protein